MAGNRINRRQLIQGALGGGVGSRLLAGSLEEVLASETDSPGAPSGAMCDLLAFPEKTLLTNATPSFSWIVSDVGTGAVQSGYQVQVATSSALLDTNHPDLWDTGRVRSDLSSGVRYAGKPLPTNGAFFWRVKTWNGQGKVSVYSPSQKVVTGEFTVSSTVARYPIVVSPIHPVRIVPKGAGTYFVDFGKAAFGRLSLRSPSSSNGRQSDVALGEALTRDTVIDPKPGGSIRYWKSGVDLLAGGTSTLPPVTQKQLPFRYAEISGWPTELKPSDITQLAEHYLFDETASRFNSSDKTLNAVWDLCKYSMKATSFLGVYIDGDRERKPYEADAYINQLGHYSVDREYTLARYTFQYLMAHPTWPTEWQPHMVFMAWADYLYTGDDAMLRTHYDALRARTLLSLAREDGLISTKTGLVTREFLASFNLTRMEDIVDWPLGERDGYKFGPINTVVNAFHYRALVLMARIARALKRSADEATLRHRAELVYKSVNEQLFDSNQGLYRDAADNDHASLHGNLFPLAFGLVPAERQKSVVAFIKSRGMACSVYAAQYLMEALYRAGEAQYALELLTAKSGRSWGHMIYDVGTTITLEAWDNRYKPNQDWNHAWGAAPANIIPRGLMGIEPVEPGWSRVRIAPQPGSLAEAEITVPTIRGSLTVGFSQAGRSLTCHVNLPANTRADLVLPSVRESKSVDVVMDGKQRTLPLVDGVCQIPNVGAGKHIFRI